MSARILIVDDEVDTCENLRDIFSDFGYQVDIAHHGEEALRLVKNNHYDVALLDLRMPGMDGLELYRRIRVLSSGTVAIVVTAYASSETAASIKGAGAWQILPKPVDFDLLFKLVSTALGQPLLLIVDDDRALCDSLWDVLREHEYRVCLSHDAPDALEKLKTRQFQVAIVDLKLPQGSGIDVLEKARAMSPATRSVLITGHRDEMEELVHQALQDGADAIAYKPFDMQKLLTTIGELSQHRAS
jgi:DNA-binding NtrC family response regulator